MNGGTDQILTTLPDYTRRELHFLVQHEKILHLDDFVLRRSMLMAWLLKLWRTLLSS